MVEPSRAMVVSSRAMGQCFSVCRVLKSNVKPNRPMLECCKIKLSHGSVQYRLEYRQVEPWQSLVESSRAKQSHGRVQQSDVEPRGAMVQSVRLSSQTKQTHGTVESNQVEPSRAMVEPSRAMVESSRMKQSQIQPWDSVLVFVESLQSLEE